MTSERLYSSVQSKVTGTGLDLEMVPRAARGPDYAASGRNQVRFHEFCFSPQKMTYYDDNEQ